LGTVLAEAIGAAFGIVVLRRLRSNPLAVTWGEILDRAAMLRMVAVNRDIMIRTMALVAAFAIFTAMGARSGDVTLAANAVLYNMFLIGGYFLDGFATAAETLCGQSLGARNERSFRRSIHLSLVWSLGFGLATSLVFLAGGGWFIDFVSTNPEVRSYARDYLVFAAISPLLGAAAFAYDGIYIGATWTRAMRDLMLVAFAAYAGIILMAQELGNTGLWIAFLVFLTVRGAGQAALSPRLARQSFA
jgi:MATE family multidrug resistance protein